MHYLGLFVREWSLVPSICTTHFLWNLNLKEHFISGSWKLLKRKSVYIITCSLRLYPHFISCVLLASAFPDNRDAGIFSSFFGYGFLRFPSPPFLLSAVDDSLPTFGEIGSDSCKCSLFFSNSVLTSLVAELHSSWDEFSWLGEPACYSSPSLNLLATPHSPWPSPFLPLSVLEPKFSFLSHIWGGPLTLIPLFTSYSTLGLCLYSSSQNFPSVSLTKTNLENSNHHFYEKIP